MLLRILHFEFIKKFLRKIAFSPFAPFMRSCSITQWLLTVCLPQPDCWTYTKFLTVEAWTQLIPVLCCWGAFPSRHQSGHFISTNPIYCALEFKWSICALVNYSKTQKNFSWMHISRTLCTTKLHFQTTFPKLFFEIKNEFVCNFSEWVN